MTRLAPILLMGALAGCGTSPETGTSVDQPDANSELGQEQALGVNQADPRPGAAQTQATGPFGLAMGMSKAAIEAAIGSDLDTVEDPSNLYRTTAVPRPLERVDFYGLLILPNAGLCQIRVAGITINSSSHGVELRNEYQRMRDALEGVYGTYREANFLRSGSIWDEPEDWMMAVRRGERVLQAAWDGEEGSTMQNNVKQVLLTVSAASTSRGWIRLQYEFDNDEECEAERNQTTSGVL